MPIRDRIRPIKHLRNRHFICVLENPRDVKNIASAIRNISAFGIEKLYVVNGPKIVHNFDSSRNNKSLSNLSVGSNKWVFVKHFKTTKECIDHLRKNLYTIAVTSSHEKGAKNVNLYEEAFDQKRLAVWFGNESGGVTRETIQSADFCIQIPMAGIVESLNLGTSTGIVLSYIGYLRLKFIYVKKKARFKPKSLSRIKMRSWREFFPMLK